MALDHKSPLPPLTLVLGGAASGKSDFAEALLRATGRPLVYVATGEAYDDEMRAKIARHIARRGDGWRTLEAPRNLGAALTQCRPNEAILIDCATMWLANVIEAEDVPSEQSKMLADLRQSPAPCVMVSNELGAGIVPENALARRFRELHGRMNQALAAQADRVVLVSAGLPLWLKGAP